MLLFTNFVFDYDEYEKNIGCHIFKYLGPIKVVRLERDGNTKSTEKWHGGNIDQLSTECSVDLFSFAAPHINGRVNGFEPN